MTATVHFKELPCQDGNTKIGVATLDNAPSLNALTYDMLALLKEKLESWARRRQYCLCLLGRARRESVLCWR